MSGYVIGMTELTDPGRMGEYQQRVPAVVERYGGRFLAAGPVVGVLEGDANPHAAVVIAFDSVDDAKCWYESDDYGAIRPLRLEGGASTVLLVSGS